MIKNSVIPFKIHSVKTLLQTSAVDPEIDCLYLSHSERSGANTGRPNTKNCQSTQMNHVYELMHWIKQRMRTLGDSIQIVCASASVISGNMRDVVNLFETTQLSYFFHFR